MTPPDVAPPDDVPEEVVRMLEDSSDQRLREVIHYAQQLLREQSPPTEEIEPREGEEIVRTDDHGGYTSVIVERPDETGEAPGPFAYRVQWEPEIDGEGGHYEWHYLGRVSPDILSS